MSRKNSKIVIFGCDHYLQKNADAFLEKNKLRQHEELQKFLNQHEEVQKHFLRTTRGLITSNQITFVGEEFDHAQISTIAKLAGELGCRYANVDMTVEEREKVGCVGDYGALFMIETQFPGTISEAQAKRKILRCNQIREEHMAKRIFELAAAGESGLLVCGNNHRHALRKLCEPNFAEVIVRSVSEYDWFDPALYRWNK